MGREHPIDEAIRRAAEADHDARATHDACSPRPDGVDGVGSACTLPGGPCGLVECRTAWGCLHARLTRAPGVLRHEFDPPDRLSQCRACGAPMVRVGSRPALPPLVDDVETYISQHRSHWICRSIAERAGCVYDPPSPPPSPPLSPSPPDGAVVAPDVRRLVGTLAALACPRCGAPCRCLNRGGWRGRWWSVGAGEAVGALEWACDGCRLRWSVVGDTIMAVDPHP